MTLKVKLKPNMRMYEADDSDFEITGKEIKELPERHLRSYSLKYYLFHGLLEVVEGELSFHMKSAIIYIAKDTLYGYEFGNYYTKDLELDTMTFIAEDEVPKNILIKINPKASAEPEVIPEVIPEDVKPSLAEMTKKELKQYSRENNISFAKNIKIAELRDLLE